jgi:hypothetical protein
MNSHVCMSIARYGSERAHEVAARRWLSKSIWTITATKIDMGR